MLVSPFLSLSPSLPSPLSPNPQFKVQHIYLGISQYNTHEAIPPSLYTSHGLTTHQVNLNRKTAFRYITTIIQKSTVQPLTPNSIAEHDPDLVQRQQSATLTLGKVPAEPEEPEIESPPLTTSLRLHTIAKRWTSSHGSSVSLILVDVEVWRYYISEKDVSCSASYEEHMCMDS